MASRNSGCEDRGATMSAFEILNANKQALPSPRPIYGSGMPGA